MQKWKTGYEKCFILLSYKNINILPNNVAMSQIKPNTVLLTAVLRKYALRHQGHVQIPGVLQLVVGIVAITQGDTF